MSVASSGRTERANPPIHTRPRPGGCTNDRDPTSGRHLVRDHATSRRSAIPSTVTSSGCLQRQFRDSALIVFARDDDYTFGVLHSRVHELWARATGTQLREVESGFRYTPTTCFETFPFPDPTPEQRERVGEAARRLVELRDGWLNPPGLDPADLEKRTLTNLYNQRPTWLANAHATPRRRRPRRLRLARRPPRRRSPRAPPGPQPQTCDIRLSRRPPMTGSLALVRGRQAEFEVSLRFESVSFELGEGVIKTQRSKYVSGPSPQHARRWSWVSSSVT